MSEIKFIYLFNSSFYAVIYRQKSSIKSGGHTSELELLLCGRCLRL